MAALTTAEANRLLDASFGTASYTAPTTPMKLALNTAIGSASAAGTEVSGGSYARQTLAMTAASAGSTPNTSLITYTSMPACTVTSVDIFDSNGTPRRCWWGPLAANKVLGAGDSISFPASNLTATLG